MTLDVYDKVRRQVTDLREFAGLEAQVIADHAGIAASGLSRFMAKEQATVSHAIGAAIEDLHATHAEVIKQRKLEKANQILTEFGYPPVNFG